jgi:hypothetical protein
LFANNIVASNFQGSFAYCSGLVGANAIPADLFKYTRATIFESCFIGCTGLTSLPAELFSYNTQATNFKNCFIGCTGLTSLPADLFSNNTQATNFYCCFYGCTGITSVPANLFTYNTEVVDFGWCFSSCTGLTTIPPALFFKNKKVTNFSYCFSDCTKLELRADIFPRATGGFSQPNFFNDRTMDFTGFCKNVGTAATTPGTAPKLWEFNYASGVTTTECFAGANVTNSGDIPNDWK